MKALILMSKKICQNGQFSHRKIDITSEKPKSPCIAAVWGRLTTGICDKESSHVVASSLNTRFLRL